MTERARTAPSASALLLGAALLFAAYRARAALTPFLLAAAFAYVLSPVATFFEAKGFRRLPVIVLGYLCALAFTAAAYYAIKPLAVEQGRHLLDRAPAYSRALQAYAAVGEASLVRRLPLPARVSRQALDAAVAAALTRLQDAPSSLLGTLPLLAHAILVPFIGFFFLKDSTEGFEALIQAAPSRYVEQALHLAAEIDTALGNYLRGLIVVAVAIGTATFLGLTLLGVENALAIALLCGITSVVPYLGVAIGIVVGGAMAMIQFSSLAAAGKVVLLFVAIRFADEILLQPVIARHSVHLHPMVNLLALVVGGEMFGFLGLVFAVPAACVLKAVAQVSWSWYATETGLQPGYASDAAGIPYT